jgi:hypothetical protein
MTKSHKFIDKMPTEWFENIVMSYKPLKNKPIVFVPCAKTHPSQISISKTCPKLVSLHEAKEISLIILSEPLTLIPWDNTNYTYDHPPNELTAEDIKVWRSRLKKWFELNLTGHAVFGALFPYHQEVVLPPMIEVGKTFSGLLIVRNFFWSMVDDIITDWRIRNRNIGPDIKARLEKELPCKYSTILEQILRFVDKNGSICEDDLTKEYFAPYCLEQRSVVLNWYTEGYAICKDPYLIKQGKVRVLNPQKRDEINKFLCS